MAETQRVAAWSEHMKQALANEGDRTNRLTAVLPFGLPSFVAAAAHGTEH